jgi:hypothetical protein
MLKKLFMKILGRKIREKWNLQDDQTVPEPGEVVVSVPWYRSKTKMGALLSLVATGLKHVPPAFGYPSIDIPPEMLSLFQEIGIGIAVYGLRDAMKEPATQLYKDPKETAPIEK